MANHDTLSHTPPGYNQSSDPHRALPPAERRSIHGIPGYHIAAAGRPWLWDKPLTIDKQEGSGLPVITVARSGCC